MAAAESRSGIAGARARARAAAVTNDSVFRHSERYSGSDEKELGYYRHVSPLGVAAQFAWQLFVKGLLRGYVIDGGRARRHRGIPAFAISRMRSQKSAR